VLVVLHAIPSARPPCPHRLIFLDITGYRRLPEPSPLRVEVDPYRESPFFLSLLSLFPAGIVVTVEGRMDSGFLGCPRPRPWRRAGFCRHCGVKTLGHFLISPLLIRITVHLWLGGRRTPPWSPDLHSPPPILPVPLVIASTGFGALVLTIPVETLLSRSLTP